jgi:hypothetical protein
MSQAHAAVVSCKLLIIALGDADAPILFVLYQAEKDPMVVNNNYD